MNILLEMIIVKEFEWVQTSRKLVYSVVIDVLLITEFIV